MAAIAAKATVGPTMIDIRLAREDPDAVKAALGRRGVDAGRDRPPPRRRRPRPQRRGTARRAAGPGEGPLPPGGRGPARRRRRPRRPAVRPRAGGQRRGARGLGADADAAQAEVRDRLLWLPEPPGRGRPRRGRARRQRRRPPLARRAPDLRRPPAGRRTGRSARPSASSTWSAAPSCRGRCSPSTGAPAPGSCGPSPPSPSTTTPTAFEEIRPPTLVRTDTMVSTGHLPKFADEAYHLERDDLWAIPTAEVPLTSMYRDDILDEAALPLRLTAATACFRREAGAAGRDTRGLLRVHEFDKVELFAYATADQAADRPRRHGRARRGPPARPRPRVPRPRPLHRRPRQLVGPHLRPRGLRPGVRHVARGVLGLLVPRLPGPPGQHPLPARPAAARRSSSTP